VQLVKQHSADDLQAWPAGEQVHNPLLLQTPLQQTLPEVPHCPKAVRQQAVMVIAPWSDTNCCLPQTDTPNKSSYPQHCLSSVQLRSPGSLQGAQVPASHHWLAGVSAKPGHLQMTVPPQPSDTASPHVVPPLQIGPVILLQPQTPLTPRLPPPQVEGA
jgi:hypothetical protein